MDGPIYILAPLWDQFTFPYLLQIRIKSQTKGQSFEKWKGRIANYIALRKTITLGFYLEPIC